MVKKTGLLWLCALVMAFSSHALTLRGIVTSAASNAPVVGAVVTFTAGVNQYLDTTVAGGTYELPAIAQTTGQLAVAATGYVTNRQFLTGLQSVDTVNVLLTPAATGAGVKRILGTVTEVGGANAVAGAQIVLLLRAGLASTALDTEASANDGKYLFDSLASGRYDLAVTKTGYLDYLSPAPLDLRTADSVLANVQLTPVGSSVGTLTGKITAVDTTVAIAGATVLLTRTTTVGGVVTTVSIDSVLTNASGVYTIAGVPAEAGYRLTASAATYVTASSANLFRVDSAVTRIENFRLAAVVVPACIIKGTVIDSGSLAAIQGAQVVLRKQQPGLAWVRIDSSTTAANGSFAFSGLDIGTYSLVVSRGDYLTYVTPLNRAVNLTANPDTATVVVAMAPVPKGTLHVMVRDNANSAITGASVTLIQRAGGVAPGQTYNATTAVDGWTVFSMVIAGPYDITVSRTGFNTTTRTGQQVAAGADDTIFVTLQAATGSSKTVKGTVKNASGAGIGAAVVVLTARAGGGATLALLDTCAADGSYGITGIPAGYAAASLSVTKAGYVTKDSAGIAIANDTTTVDIVLAPNSGVTSLPARPQAELRVTVLANALYLSGVKAELPLHVTIYSVNGQMVWDRIYNGAGSLMIPRTWSHQIMYLRVEQGNKVIREKIAVR